MSTMHANSVMFRVIDVNIARKAWQRRSFADFHFHSLAPQIQHHVYVDTAQRTLQAHGASLILTYVNHTLQRASYHHEADQIHTALSAQDYIPTTLSQRLADFAITVHQLLPVAHTVCRHQIREVWHHATLVAHVHLIIGSTQHGTVDDIQLLHIDPVPPHTTVMEQLVQYYQEQVPLMYPRPEDAYPLPHLEALPVATDSPPRSEYTALSQHTHLLLSSTYTADQMVFMPMIDYDTPQRRTLAACAVQIIRGQHHDTEPMWLACDNKQRAVVQQLVADNPLPEHPLDLLAFDYNALPFAEVLRMLLRGQFRKILLRRQQVHLTNAASDIHRLRVTLRKTLALLDCAESVYDAELTRQYRRGLRRMARFLGVIRDCDTLSDNVTRILGVHQVPASMARAIAQTRAHALAQLNDLLSQSKQQKFLSEFARFVSTAGHACIAQPAPLAEALSERLRYRLQSLQQPFTESFRNVTESEIHEFRIRCRDLRYLIEAFPEGILMADSTIITTLTHIQDQLGGIQDAAVTQQLLTDMKLGHESPAKRVLSALREESHTIRQELPAIWEQITSPEFTAAIELLVARLSHAPTRSL